MATKSKVSKSPKPKRKRKLTGLQLRTEVWRLMDVAQDENGYDMFKETCKIQAMDLCDNAASLEGANWEAVREFVWQWREDRRADAADILSRIDKGRWAEAAAIDIEALFRKTFIKGARVKAIEAIVQSAISMASISAVQAAEHENRGCRI